MNIRLLSKTRPYTSLTIYQRLIIGLPVLTVKIAEEVNWTVSLLIGNRAVAIFKAFALSRDVFLRRLWSTIPPMIYIFLCYSFTQCQNRSFRVLNPQ